MRRKILDTLSIRSCFYTTITYTDNKAEYFETIFNVYIYIVYVYIIRSFTSKEENPNDRPNLLKYSTRL